MVCDHVAVMAGGVVVTVNVLALIAGTEHTTERACSLLPPSLYETPVTKDPAGQSSDSVLSDPPLLVLPFCVLAPTGTDVMVMVGAGPASSTRASPRSSGVSAARTCSAKVSGAMVGALELLGLLVPAAASVVGALVDFARRMRSSCPHVFSKSVAERQASAAVENFIFGLEAEVG